MFPFIKLLLSMSHVNCPRERVCDKQLCSTVTRIVHLKKTIEALRCVKDEIDLGSIMKFLIKKELHSSAKDAHEKYVVDLKTQRELRENEKSEKEKDEKEKNEKVQKRESLFRLEIELVIIQILELQRKYSKSTSHD